MSEWVGAKGMVSEQAKEQAWPDHLCRIGNAIVKLKLPMGDI